MINESDKRIIEKAIHRELSIDEWRKLIKSDWIDIYNLIKWHIEEKRKIKICKYQEKDMLEHVFRNINDIRIFDLMSEFVYDKEELEGMDNDKGSLDIDEIMKLLDYPEYKRLEVEDSVEHFIRNKILDIRKIDVEGYGGCKTCSWTDKLKIPRVGEHKKHVPYETRIGEFDTYYMLRNELTRCLISAVFAHVFITCDTIPDNEKEKEKEIQPNQV